jgi:hypothetical protein
MDRKAEDKTLKSTVCQEFSKDNVVEGYDFTIIKVY